jgi:hypothetical protein
LAVWAETCCRLPVVSEIISATIRRLNILWAFGFTAKRLLIEETGMQNVLLL